MIHYLTVLKAIISISIEQCLEYRVNWIFGIFSTLIDTAVTIFVIFTIFQRTQNLSGWSLEEIIVLIGVYRIVIGTAEATFIRGLSSLPVLVRTGELNRFIVMPCSTLYLLTIYGISFVPFIQVLFGVGLVLTGILTLPSNYWMAELFAGTFAIACGVTLLYMFWLSCMSLSFWLVEISNLQVLISIFTKYGQYPMGIFPKTLQIIFQSLFPIGVVISFPTKVLIGHGNLQSFFWGILLLCTFAVMSQKLWRYGLKSYTGVGV